jgi:DNA helicase HerA-like ATPase
MNRDLFSWQADVVEPPSSAVERLIGEYEAEETKREAQEALGDLVQQDQYVGEVFSLGYETALVQIHDSHRQKVGGIPSLSFLIATRVVPGEPFDFRNEDSSVLLLRVMDAAPLPNDDEATRVRVQAARQVAGPAEGHWDDATVMDHHTAGLLGFAGVRCRVIGTFYLSPSEDGDEARLRLQFGADLSNYYPNRGLKVYKPNGEALRRIVNYREGDEVGVGIGEVRYASTSRSFQGVRDVRVTVVPEDLLGQKSALFGMTRTGKSNTTKIIAKAVFDLRYGDPPRRVGQIIFDPNGEYANANAQDAGGEAPNALKNVWRAHQNGSAADVVTYGILRHPNDPGRRMMLVNFYEGRTLSIGKEIIDSVLAGHNAIYISNFRQVQIDKEPPRNDFGGEATRARRRILTYRALLARAGFAVPKGFVPRTKRLFGEDLLKAMAASQDTDYQTGARLLRLADPTWDQVALGLQYLDSFVHTKGSGYEAFNSAYMTEKDASGDPWADESLKKLLRMFGYDNGARLIGGAIPQHTSEVGTDYADDIYDALVKGKLVIVDQSSGDEAVNDASARRIVQRIFDGNKEAFRQGKPKEEIPDILVYAEEAHNLLPSDRETDYRDIWVRLAKEGAKYNLGLIYVTQEVSSIQRNILKNTANWFIGHLNNTDETRELRKFYDFADFEGSILRAQDKGFLRVKTISNPFVVPVQVREFVLRFAPGKEPT